MPGGLIQLSQVGAQNHLINGNPSMTHFRAVYRRHTNFAMESIRMDFSSSNLDFNFVQTRTLSCRVDRYAQLLHDTYLVLTSGRRSRRLGTPLPQPDTTPGVPRSDTSSSGSRTLATL